MSFRCPFITDFIYQASEDTRDANKPTEAVFEKYAAALYSSPDERGYGVYSGFLKNLDSSIQDTGCERLVSELEKVTKVPFRLTVMMESGPVLIYEITPTKTDKQ